MSTHCDSNQNVDHINQLNPATLWCLSQDKTWIPNAIYIVVFFCGLRLEVVVRFDDSRIISIFTFISPSQLSFHNLV